MYSFVGLSAMVTFGTDDNDYSILYFSGGGVVGESDAS